MAMDRVEKVGFGAAIGGHVILLGAFGLGLLASADTVKKQGSISVSLVGEIADVSTAPDAIQEESAPPAAGDTTPSEPPPAPTPVMQIEKPVAKPVQKPAKLDTAPPVPKVAAKKEPVKQPPVKAATPKADKAATSGKGTAPAKPGGLSRSFEDSINNIGKAPGAGKAVGTPAARSAAVIRSATNNTISAEVRPLIPPCTPRTSDNSSLKVFVALNIGQSGNLLDASVYKLLGETPSNAAQIPQVKQCVLNSLRAASPYNLNPEEFETWKNHKVQIEVNFK
jgi:outer membrane biosynthesis protein TonB